MGLKRLLECVLVFSALMISKCQGQDVTDADCTSFATVTMSNMQVLINTTGIPCVRCADADGQPGSNNRFILGQGLGNGLSESNGVLVVQDPARFIPDGIQGLTAGCTSDDFVYQNFEVVSNNIVPPSTFPMSAITILEGGTPETYLCIDRNLPELDVTIQWLNPRGMPADEEVGGVRLAFINITRFQAGGYVCVLTSGLTGRTATGNLPVVVQYAPEATTTEEPSQTANLEGNLTLTCDFDGVPTPSVVWTQNNSIEMNETGRIFIGTTAVSTLTVTGLGRDDGGLYTCSFENLVDDLDVNVTTVLILIPPAPVTSLENTTFMERAITVTWTKGFDGFTPITGATIEYSEEGGSSIMIRTVNSMDPTAVTLSNLTPFTNYIINVSLFNIVGTGDSTSIQVQTKSLQLLAPTNVMITVESSTVLTVSWSPPVSSPDTDASEGWFVKLSQDGTVVNETTIEDEQITMETFRFLLKGTMYNVTVRGENEVGPGVFSAPMSGETVVDPPTEPQNVSVEGVTSFALRVRWDPPLDNGGRPILDYTIAVPSISFTETVAAEDRMFLIREEPDGTLMENTAYSVNVSARNRDTPPQTGPPATASGTTVSIDDPQAILEEPIVDSEMNTSVDVTWVYPGGDVTLYLIQYTQVLLDIVVNVTVENDTTSYTLTGLDVGTSYSVVVFSVNSRGLSIASPLTEFDTLPALPPRITGPDGVVMAGTTVVLTCMSPDTKPFMWSERDRNISLVLPVFEFSMDKSVLTINDIRPEHSGVYVCRVGMLTGAIRVDVQIIVTTTAPPGGISNMVIIIAASIGGGGALIILLCLIFVLVFCCCCRGKDKTDKYITNRVAMKPDKRTKELFEVSTSAAYAPVRDSTGVEGTDTGISFNMPEDYQAHSSFNTLDKADKPDAAAQQRSASPEPVNASFGVRTSDSNGAGSPPRYQDMPPNYDGTLL